MDVAAVDAAYRAVRARQERVRKQAAEMGGWRRLGAHLRTCPRCLGREACGEADALARTGRA